MFFYNLAIRCYAAFIWLASFFNHKAKLWIGGRKHWQRQLGDKIQAAQIKHPVWFHCASLGEFEQGRPLMEAIKAQFPEQQILLTFFSPSGFEVRKDYEFADAVLYMPLDTKANAQAFLDIVQPRMAVFVKYEFWLNFLFQLKQRSVPTYLVSAVFKSHQPFFKWYGSIFRKALGCYHIIFTQDQASARLLPALHVNSIVVAGDTRFDRVLHISQHPRQLEEAALFTKNNFTIIGGSTWPKDEELLLEAFAEIRKVKPHLKLIIAPHEIDQPNIERLWNLIGSKHLKYKFITDEFNGTEDVLIVNTMGYLSSIYQYAQLAVIGGGFNDGIHNILEPSVYGLPVLFGPNYHKFNEATELLNLKGALSFSNQAELTTQLSSLASNHEAYADASARAKSYVRQNAGATDQIMAHLKPLLQK